MAIQNVLLIDDDADDQEIFLEAVKIVSDTIQCVVLSNAVVALEKLTSKNVTPDVIFLDLNMPLMSGQEFLLAKKNYKGLKNIPVIIFSTSSHGPTIRLTKELGASEFVTKPGNFNELVAILRTIFQNAG